MPDSATSQIESRHHLVSAFESEAFYTTNMQCAACSYNSDSTSGSETENSMQVSEEFTTKKRRKKKKGRKTSKKPKDNSNSKTRIEHRYCKQIISKQTNRPTRLVRIVPGCIRSYEYLLVHGFFYKNLHYPAYPSDPPPAPLPCQKCEQFIHKTEDCKQSSPATSAQALTILINALVCYHLNVVPAKKDMQLGPSNAP